MCSVYSAVFSEFLFLNYFAVFIEGILWIFSAFLADISAFLPSVAVDFPVFFVCFLTYFRWRSSIFFLALFAVFLHQPIFLFCTLILLEVFF